MKQHRFVPNLNDLKSDLQKYNSKYLPMFFQPPILPKFQLNQMRKISQTDMWKRLRIIIPGQVSTSNYGTLCQAPDIEMLMQPIPKNGRQKTTILINNTKPPSKSLFSEVWVKIKPKGCANTNIQIAIKVPRITAHLHPKWSCSLFRLE